MNMEKTISTALLAFGLIFILGRAFLTESGMGKAYVMEEEIMPQPSNSDAEILKWKTYEKASQKEYIEAQKKDPNQTKIQFSLSR